MGDMGQHTAGATPPQQPRPSGFVQRWRDAAATSQQETREAWPGMTVYERFEQVVAVLVTLLISVLITAIVVRLTVTILALIFGLADLAEKEIFQAVFGMIMTVLIALEFNHSIRSVLERSHGVVQVGTVVLIALMALVRQFIIIEVTEAQPVTIVRMAAAVGMAAAVRALGAVYRMIRNQDRRDADTDGAHDRSVVPRVDLRQWGQAAPWPSPGMKSGRIVGGQHNRLKLYAVAPIPY